MSYTPQITPFEPKRSRFLRSIMMGMTRRFDEGPTMDGPATYRI